MNFKIWIQDSSGNPATQFGSGIFKLEKLILDDELKGNYFVRIENLDLLSNEKKKKG
jgi:hypothetical protein